MGGEYILFSAKLSGWFTAGGTYTSEVKDAQRFSWKDAMAICRRHYDVNMKEIGMIPVFIKDIEWAL